MDAMLSELADMFAETVGIEPFLGASSYGVASYGPSYSVKARIVGRRETISEQDAQEPVQSFSATLMGFYGVTSKDRFTLPAAYSNNLDDPNDLEARQPRAISVDFESDENGPHHQIVHFAKARLRGY